MNLVQNWTNAWKWFSMQSLALIALINVTYAALSPEAAAALHITPVMVQIVTVAISFIGGLGRLILQPSANPSTTGDKS